MSKKTLLGILFGMAALTVACLCAPIGLLPLRWTTTTQPLQFIPTQAFEATEGSAGEASPLCVYQLSEALHQSETIYLSGSELETDFALVTYTVSGDSIIDPVRVNPIPPKLKGYQEDTVTQQRMWEFFTEIIPADRRGDVTQFSVFTDGPNNSLGAVSQTGDPHHWKLEMDIQDSRNFADLSSTLVHEFGHLLTLNDNQVTPNLDVFEHPGDQNSYDRADADCPTYFMFEGCSLPDSYINKFFQRFWPDLFARWKQIDSETDEQKLDQDLEAFYEQHISQFVSSYAVTSPEEDIAESFMYFIFTARPGGTRVADQKILFFYDDPGMKSLREQLLSRLCNYVGKQ